MGTVSKYSSWRQQNVEIPANSVKDVVFMDSHPNAFYVVNNNDADIYIGMVATPTTERYDVQLKRYYSDVFGRPIPCNRLYVLNDSPKDIIISVFSSENNFDMSLLKNFKVEMENAVLENLRYDGIINGVKNGVKIPVEGSFTAEFPENLEVKFPVDATVSVKGGVQLTGTALTEVQGIGNLLEGFLSGGGSLQDILTALGNLNFTSSYSNIKAGQLTAAGAVTFNFKEVDLLTNDSESDVTITFGDQVFILKPGESINDLSYNGTGFSVAGDAVSVRYILLG